MANVRFVGDTMRLCRQFLGLSQADLADKIGISRQYIHQLETGERTPNELTTRAMAAALYVDSSLLGSVIEGEIGNEDCHFRKLKTTPQWLINQVAAHGTQFQRLLDFIEEHLDLPEINFPQIEVNSKEDIEVAAEQCRAQWGLTLDQPIKNMVRVVETAGAVVVSFEGVSNKLDALSVHRGRPIIIRSNYKESPTRFRFDVAHECGHLVMHKGLQTGDHKRESEADRFAGAFLLPRAAFVAEFPRTRQLHWDKLYELKSRWNVSLQAIIRRAWELSIIDALQYKRAQVYIAKSGQKKSEKGEPDFMEKGEVLAMSLQALKEHYGYTILDLESHLGIKGEALRRLLSEENWERLQPGSGGEVVEFENSAISR